MTNNIQQMHFDSILPEVKAINKKQVFQQISKHISNMIGTSEKFLFDILVNNEDIDSSAIGNGVAVAHAKVPRLTKPMIIFAKSPKPINFNAFDGEPVDLFCVLLSPEYQASQHLQRLAMTTRFFKDDDVRNDLRKATDYDTIRMVVSHSNIKKKAA